MLISVIIKQIIDNVMNCKQIFICLLDNINYVLTYFAKSDSIEFYIKTLELLVVKV